MTSHDQSHSSSLPTTPRSLFTGRNVVYESMNTVQVNSPSDLRNSILSGPEFGAMIASFQTSGVSKHSYTPPYTKHTHIYTHTVWAE